MAARDVFVDALRAGRKLVHRGFGIERFNTPPTSRSSTTAHRYYLAVTAYVLFGLVAYAVPVRFPTFLGQAFPGLQNALGDSGASGGSIGPAGRRSSRKPPERRAPAGSPARRPAARRCAGAALQRGASASKVRQSTCSSG
jgi:hypothetical protein